MGMREAIEKFKLSLDNDLESNVFDANTRNNLAKCYIKKSLKETIVKNKIFYLDLAKKNVMIAIENDNENKLCEKILDKIENLLKISL